MPDAYCSAQPNNQKIHSAWVWWGSQMYISFINQFFFWSERMENEVIIHGKGLNLQMVCLVDFGWHKNNFNSVYWGWMSISSIKLQFWSLDCFLRVFWISTLWSELWQILLNCQSNEESDEVWIGISSINNSAWLVQSRDVEKLSDGKWKDRWGTYWPSD